MKLWENLYPLILDTAIVNTNPDNLALKNVHLEISNPRDLSYLCKYAEEKFSLPFVLHHFITRASLSMCGPLWNEKATHKTLLLLYNICEGVLLLFLFIWKCFTESHEPACSTGMLVDKGW